MVYLSDQVVHGRIRVRDEPEGSAAVEGETRIAQLYAKFAA